ncbi:MAG: hypothetical protein LBU32_09990 [Clostridiales bacterium]|nr:hypothetical protein [Clostridiales bacterium]
MAKKAYVNNDGRYYLHGNLGSYGDRRNSSRGFPLGVCLSAGTADFWVRALESSQFAVQRLTST